MKFIYSDGGRSKYFKATDVGDCVTRAICNATGMDYKEVYDGLKELAKHERITKKHKHKSSVRDGTSKKTTKKYIESIGWVWVPVMQIGSGCTKHLSEDDFPSIGTYIVSVSQHLTCIKDGVLYDTYDCSRDGTRCVYGYWYKPTAAVAPKPKAPEVTLSEACEELRDLQKSVESAYTKACIGKVLEFIRKQAL